MSTTQRNTWKTGWTAEEPLQIGYVAVGKDEGTWKKGERSYLEYRDLGVSGVTDGKMGVQHIRSSERVSSDWHAHDLDFQFFYVLAGSIEIENERGDKVTLGPGDSGYHPGLFWHRETVSDDYEVVEITGPAKGETITGRDNPLPERANELDPERGAVYTYERPESYAKGNGPRSFFRYRDLGTAEPSEGRMHIHVVRAGEPGAGTGWHYHSMAQWFMILGGEAGIRVEDRPLQTIRTGDTMCIGSGPNMRHNVAPFTADYAVLEMCVPAEYETTAVPPPENAAPAPEGAQE
jgi:quercetin dioxygenase-like cupin family protein